MKIFSKFRQFSREIKLIIITALIVSCVGVYAAGECIISATADDVTYNNTTVQAAIDELYSMSQDYCPPGYECTRTINTIMENGSVFDAGPSTYVTGSNGIDFSQISSNTNGKGLYEISSTHNDPHPIFYYRGDVHDNNVKFAGFCWKVVRTTDTGGVKMIYNGEPDQNGYCTNTTGPDTQIGTSKFNTSDSSPAHVGYMYGVSYSTGNRYDLALNTSYVYGNDVTYSGGTYTLTNTMTSTGTWANDYNTFNNHHYTCFSTGTTCSSVYYIFYTSSMDGAFYITLTNGKKVSDALDEMLNNNNINTNDSAAKTQLDNWYNTNLSSYTNYIEDTVYCNDRSISQLGGWDPNGGSTTSNYQLLFNSYKRAYSQYTPSLSCSRALDRFTVSSANGNGALTYPVGLLTSDEMMYAGGRLVTDNTTFYLYSNQYYWTISPIGYNSTNNINYPVVHIIDISNSGDIISKSVAYPYGLRPVISLKPDLLVESGDGTSTNPYVIQTS